MIHKEFTIQQFDDEYLCIHPTYGEVVYSNLSFHRLKHELDVLVDGSVPDGSAPLPDPLPKQSAMIHNEDYTLYYRNKRLVIETELPYGFILQDYVTSLRSSDLDDTLEARLNSRLKYLFDWCYACHTPLDLCTEPTKPLLCQSDFCLFRIEHFAEHIINVQTYIDRNPVVAKLLVSLAVASGDPQFACLSSVSLLETSWVKDAALYRALAIVFASCNYDLELVKDREGLPFKSEEEDVTIFAITTPLMSKEALFRQHKQANGGRTIYAYHGSHLKYWFSILKSGLNFDKIVNGRVYGDGIYHAKSYTTGFCYSGRAQDTLSVVAVNEIIDCPDEFVSRHPHIVISNVEWVQIRYLLVRETKPDTHSKDV